MGMEGQDGQSQDEIPAVKWSRETEMGGQSKKERICDFHVVCLGCDANSSSRLHYWDITSNLRSMEA
jgi:hypothetical protein